MSRFDSAFRSLFDRLVGRAWSRAGAVAEVLSRGVARRVLTTSVRFGYLVAGSALIALSVSITFWTQLGPGPLDVFIGAVSGRTGLPLAVAVWVTVGSLILLATLLGRRPGVGTVLSPFIIGPVLGAAVHTLERFDAPDTLMVTIPLQLVAIAGIGLGAGMLIVSGLGAGSGELLAGAGSDRTGRTESVVRFGFEMTWVIIGVALGGPAGLGTLLVAALVGPSVENGYRVADRWAERAHRRVASAHASIVDRDIERLNRSLVDTMPR